MYTLYKSLNRKKYNINHMKELISIKDLYKHYYKKWKEGTLTAKDLNMNEQEFELFIKEMQEVLNEG